MNIHLAVIRKLQWATVILFLQKRDDFLQDIPLRTGYAHLVEPCAMGATAMGADALIIEVHNNPSKALCDGVQSQTPEMFRAMMEKISAIKPYAWKRG
jgi:3-deoxy-D-arabino-heptulosonate 7-phosphate (DAHP) synthase